MGIKGSATCSLTLDGALGWLVGEPHRGLSAMFVMMNSARLHVGLQGLGHLEMAQQNALVYAKERAQGQGRLIAEHPLVARKLWELRALAEGQRVIAYWTATLLDESHHHADPVRRARSDSLVTLLTPVVKCFFTDNGHNGADQAMQIWGGYGYLHDFGIEQSVRDSRIAMIYEGTNEIQALDLLQRKVIDDRGARLQLLLEVLEAERLACAERQELALFSHGLDHQINSIREAVQSVTTYGGLLPTWPARIATDFLRGIGFALLAWAWARTAAKVVQLNEREDWHDAKLAAARFGVEWLLPEADLCWQRVRLGARADLPPIVQT